VDAPRELGESGLVSDMLVMLDGGQEALKKEGIAIKTFSRNEAISSLCFLQWDVEAYECHKLRKFAYY
jgi:hypothetical protein